MSFSQIISRANAEALIPVEGAREIVKAATQSSAALALCRRATMSSKVYKQPVLSALPEAYWVADGGLKQTSSASWDGIELVAEELAVVLPIEDNTVADADFNIWQELRDPLGEKFAQRIDQAVFSGEGKPASWPDAIIPGAVAAGNVADTGASVAEGGIVGDLEATLSVVEDEGFDPTAFAGARTLKRRLRRARTADGSALGEGSTERQWDLGITYAVAGSIPPPTLAVAGDFTMAIVAIRQDLTMQMFSEGVISDEQGRIIHNLMQSDMSALRATMRVAFAVAAPATLVGDDGYPFAVLRASASGSPANGANGDSEPEPATRTTKPTPAKK
jgi:HK97 family phage major capsid protein